MNYQELKSKYPEQNVQSEPAQKCPICNGKGEFINKLRKIRPCICVCLSEQDPKIRAGVADSFQKSVKSLRKEFGASCSFAP